MPLGLCVDGANRHDKKLLEPTLAEPIVPRPAPTPEALQHLCLDAGYDYPDVDELLGLLDFFPHLRRRGQARATHPLVPGYRARRWVVERTHSWLNRFRRLLIRWEKKVRHYLAFLHFACAWVAFRAAGVIG